MIVDPLPKPSALEGSVEFQIRSAASTVQVNRYQWDEPREAVFKSDSPIIDLLLSRRLAGLDGEFLEAPGCGPRPVGDILFMPPNYTLHSRWDRGERRSMCCVLESRAFGDFFNLDWAGQKLASSLNVRNRSIRAIMTRLVSEAVAPSFASELLVESLSMTLAIELRRHFDMLDPEPALQNGGLSARQLGQVRETLEAEDPNCLVTVAALARAAGMSVRHFSRLFRASTGATVSAYAARIRIERAKLLLADERLLIKEIAFRCGFQSSSSFCAAFRQATDMTPQTFRSVWLD